MFVYIYFIFILLHMCVYTEYMSYSFEALGSKKKKNSIKIAIFTKTC